MSRAAAAEGVVGATDDELRHADGDWVRDYVFPLINARAKQMPTVRNVGQKEKSFVLMRDCGAGRKPRYVRTELDLNLHGNIVFPLPDPFVGSKCGECPEPAVMHMREQGAIWNPGV
eukprot:SAG11_NODE_11622_length_748_cov_1.078582_2_plen_117_part_00